MAGHHNAYSHHQPGDHHAGGHPHRFSGPRPQSSFSQSQSFSNATALHVTHGPQAHKPTKGLGSPLRHHHHHESASGHHRRRGGAEPADKQPSSLTSSSELFDEDSYSTTSTTGAPVDPREIQMSENVETKYVSYGFASMQGRRKRMQDGHTMLPDFELVPGCQGVSFFGVYDGHGTGGEHLAELCETLIPERIREETHDLEPLTITNAFDHVFQNFDKELINDVHHMGISPGTTAVVLVVTPSNFVVGWAGDSRCVMCRGGQCVPLTSDHLIENSEEMERIKAAGADLEVSSDGGYRVHGLNMSRSFGDIDAKLNGKLPQDQQGVIAKPDVTITPRSEDIDFVILCCDGIFEVMTNEELVSFALQRYKKGESNEEICRAIALACLDGGSGDNMSVIMLTFPATPSSDVVVGTVTADSEPSDTRSWWESLTRSRTRSSESASEARSPTKSRSDPFTTMTMTGTSDINSSEEEDESEDDGAGGEEAEEGAASPHRQKNKNKDKPRKRWWCC